MHLALFLLSVVGTWGLSTVNVYESVDAPKRTVLTKDETLKDAGWVSTGSFLSFVNASTIGSVEMVYAEDNSDGVRRGIVIPAGGGLDGWTSKWSFWVMPEEHWCSCKVFVTQTGHDICDGGPASVTPGTIPLDDPLLNKVDESNAVYGYLCNTTDKCKCVYSFTDWANNFAQYGLQNQYECQLPHLTNDSAASVWTSPSYYSDGHITETIGISIFNFASILNMPSDDYFHKFFQQYIATLLNLANGACGDCSKYPFDSKCTEVRNLVASLSPSLFNINNIDSKAWFNTYLTPYTTFLQFNQGVYLPSCGPGSFDDKEIGGGCCTQCPRPLPHNLANSRDLYHIAGESAASSNKGNYHRMSVSLSGYSTSPGWCPRMSFWSPCPEWDDLHYLSVPHVTYPTYNCNNNNPCNNKDLRDKAGDKFAASSIRQYIECTNPPPSAKCKVMDCPSPYFWDQSRLECT